MSIPSLCLCLCLSFFFILLLFYLFRISALRHSAFPYHGSCTRSPPLSLMSYTCPCFGISFFQVLDLFCYCGGSCVGNGPLTTELWLLRRDVFCPRWRWRALFVLDLFVISFAFLLFLLFSSTISSYWHAPYRNAPWNEAHSLGRTFSPTSLTCTDAFLFDMLQYSALLSATITWWPIAWKDFQWKLQKSLWSSGPGVGNV